MPVPWIILVVLLWISVIALVVMVLGLNRRLFALESSFSTGAVAGPVKFFSDAIAVGTPLPHQEALLGPITERGRTVLLFFRAGCTPCHELAEKLAAAGDQARLDNLDAGAHKLVVVTNNADGAASFGNIGRVVVDRDDELSRALGVNSSPAGLGVDRNGIVCSKAVLGSVDDVRRLAESCFAAPKSAVALAGAPPRGGSTPSPLLSDHNHDHSVARGGDPDCSG